MTVRSGYRHQAEPHLTSRQRDVLKLIADGKTNFEIADELGIGYESVKSHVSEVLGKLGVDRREDAARWWREEHSLRRRMARFGAGFVALFSRRAGAVTTGTAALLLGAALVLVLFAHSDDGTRPGASATGTPPSTTTEPPCPVDPELCAFGREREHLLEVGDLPTFITPSPWQRSGDSGLVKVIESALPATAERSPRLFGIGCPLLGDSPEATCARAFVLAFASVSPGLGVDDTAAIAEFYFERDSPEPGIHDLRGMNVLGGADRERVLQGGQSLEPRDFNLPRLFAGPVDVTWYPMDRALGTPSAQAPTQTPLRAIRGLFSDPREVRWDEVRAVGAPVSSFSDWDGVSTMIYDLRAGSELDLGPGSNVAWSPDGSKAAWVASENALGAGGISWLLDLETGARRELGPARFVRFEDPDTVLLIFAASNDGELLNLATGARTPTSLGGVPEQRRPRGPYYLETSANLGPALERGGTARWQFELRSSTAGGALYRFEAFAAIMAGDDSFVVATPPIGRLTNLFRVDIASGQAFYVATAEISSPNWPFTATERFIAWTDGYCDETPGPSRLFDRDGGKVVLLSDGATGPEEIHQRRYFSFTRHGLLQVGPFGGGALLDPATLEYAAVVPGSHVSWSPDYRYAAHGQFGGHGGLC